MDQEFKNSSSSAVVEEKGASNDISAVDAELATGTVRVFESTHRGLKARHSQMIALGGTIGTGLFVGSGVTLAKGGPLFIFLGYSILAILVYFVVTAITEVAAYLPVPGGTMAYYGNRNVSKSLGFALGWLYWYSLGILVPFEITAAGIVIGYWPNSINIAVWISIFIVVIVALNLLPVVFYGETEFWFASLKVFLMLGLLILSFILFWGGGPDQHHQVLGFRYWRDPGATNTWIKTGGTGTFIAFIGTVVASAFPFTFAPEMLITTGGEMQSPRRNLPKASNRYFFRLVFFYIGCVVAIGIICPFNNPKLTDGGVGAASSAFVIGIDLAGIKNLGSVVNAAVIASAWSSGNSFLYMSSRSLYSLAVAGNAPAIFKRCTKRGVPYMAVMASSVFCALAYLNCSNSGATVFNWFVNLTNTSGFISWICCGIIYLRFRKACQVQGQTDLPYHSILQPWGAYVAIVGFSILVLINGFDVFFPSRWSVSSFMTDYVGIPAFLVIYFGHRVWFRHEPWMYKPEDVDLVTDLDTIIAGEKPVPENQTIWIRIREFLA